MKKKLLREYVMIGWYGKNLASMEISCFARRAARTLTVPSRCGRLHKSKSSDSADIKKERLLSNDVKPRAIPGSVPLSRNTFNYGSRGLMCLPKRCEMLSLAHGGRTRHISSAAFCAHPLPCIRATTSGTTVANCYTSSRFEKLEIAQLEVI